MCARAAASHDLTDAPDCVLIKLTPSWIRVPREMMQPPKATDQQIAYALERARGNVSKAAKDLATSLNVPISRAWLDNKCRTKPELAAILSDLRESLVDEAEDVLTENVADLRDLGAAQFVLRTLGRDRGYVPKTAVDLNAVGDLAETLRAARLRTLTSPPDFTRELIEGSTSDPEVPTPLDSDSPQHGLQPEGEHVVNG